MICGSSKMKERSFWTPAHMQMVPLIIAPIRSPSKPHTSPNRHHNPKTNILHIHNVWKQSNFILLWSVLGTSLIRVTICFDYSKSLPFTPALRSRMAMPTRPMRPALHPPAPLLIYYEMMKLIVRKWNDEAHRPYQKNHRLSYRQELLIISIGVCCFLQSCTKR
jgi:hypothetical protein